MPAASETPVSNAENQPTTTGQNMDWTLSEFAGNMDWNWYTTHDKLESAKPLTLLQRRFMIAHLKAYGSCLMVGKVTDIDGSQVFGDLDEVFQPENVVFPQKRQVPLVLQDLRLPNGYKLVTVYETQSNRMENSLTTRFSRRVNRESKVMLFDYKIEPYLEKTFNATYSLREHIEEDKSNNSILTINLNDGDKIPGAWLSIQLRDTEKNEVCFDYINGLLTNVRILLVRESGNLSSFVKVAIESINENVVRMERKRPDYVDLSRDEFLGNIPYASELFDLVHFGYVRKKDEDRDKKINIPATIKLMVAAANEESFKQAYECLVFSK